jgi:hypothetical protein
MPQIFTRPVDDQPTLFYEITQRKGSRSSRKAISKHFSKPSKREQAQHGNL